MQYEDEEELIVDWEWEKEWYMDFLENSFDDWYFN